MARLGRRERQARKQTRRRAYVTSMGSILQGATTCVWVKAGRKHLARITRQDALDVAEVETRNK